MKDCLLFFAGYPNTALYYRLSQPWHYRPCGMHYTFCRDLSWAVSEKAMAPHSSTLAWTIPGTVEPGGLPSMGSHRVGHNWSDLAAVLGCIACLARFSVPYPKYSSSIIPLPHDVTIRMSPDIGKYRLEAKFASRLRISALKDNNFMSFIF